MKPHRTERDSLGEIEVPADRYWGAQAQRSLENFPIGTQKMPGEVIHALALIKREAARVNQDLAGLEPALADAIVAAADRVLAHELDDHFPLAVWQTGSGTQTNMNVNEVLANVANEALGQTLGTMSPVHPNDHVNRSQSSNDTFPTAVHLAVALALRDRLLPALDRLALALEEKATAWDDLVKIGRTHTQDATPLTLGQEFSGYAMQVRMGIERLDGVRGGVHRLAQGGTAVGTGLNAPAGFAVAIAARLAAATGLPLVTAPNKFEALASRDALVMVMGALGTVAASLFKIANDLRYLGSGPRAGLGELSLPANEPGSSIMPGKVNPTQVEALTQLCIQVMGYQAAVTFAGSQGQFELNVYGPLIAHDVLDAIRLLTDGAESFTTRCVVGIEPRRDNLARGVERSLMLVTALAPTLGYDTAATIAKRAHANGTTLREEAVSGGFITGEDFDRIVVPEQMLGAR